MKSVVNIGVVIVTYNRLNMLKEALKRYDVQTKTPQYILIVNNASNDGTLEYLTHWKGVQSDYKRIVFNLDYNLGGSGGFYKGLEEAEHLDANWIWVSDDDAFPKENAFEEVEKYLNSGKYSSENIAALCGMIMNNGRIDITHRRRIKQYGFIIKDKEIPEKMYKNCFELNAFSYVGTIMNKDALMKAGLPEKNYFILWDDTEHSIRLSKYGKIVCVPSICVYHGVKEEANSLTWKYYYAWRNKAAVYKKHFSKLSYNFFYYSLLFMSNIKIVLGYKVINNRIKIRAIKDANSDKLGLHDKYKPGWSIQKNDS